MSNQYKDVSTSQLKAILREARSKYGKQLDNETKELIKEVIKSRKSGYVL